MIVSYLIELFAILMIPDLSPQDMAPAGPAIHWEVHPMERLTDAIATLVYQPVKIERIASEQTETLNASIGDAFTLDGAVDTIYESCMTERGFRLVH